jgi:hypothetical protein
MSSQRFNIPENYSSNEDSGSNLPLILLSVFIIAIIAGSIIYGSGYYRQRENFEDASSLNKNYELQYYHMPNCGHCTDFQRVWDDIVSRTSKNQAIVNYTTAKYDITDNKEGTAAGQRNNVNSTPTILLYNISTGKIIPYEKERNASDIIAFATENAK